MLESYTAGIVDSQAEQILKQQYINIMADLID